MRSTRGARVVACLFAGVASACGAFEAVGIIDEDQPAPSPIGVDASSVTPDAAGSTPDGGTSPLDASPVDAATLDASTGGWLCVPALRASFSDKLACLNDQTNRGCAPSEITDGTPCDPVGRTATSCTTCIRLGTGEYAYNPSSCQCAKP